MNFCLSLSLNGRKRYKKLFKETDLFLCEGAFGAKILEESGCPKER